MVGATGIHSTWLAEDGYEVELIDPVPGHVATARGIGTFLCREGDVRSLDNADETIDAVLLLGPLYHLIDRDDRLAALREARRVLRPGGCVAAAAISRYLPVLELGATRGLDQERLGHASEVIRTGDYEPFLGFTTAHFHLPEELRAETAEAGFVDVQVVGIEGPVWMAFDALEMEVFERHVDAAAAVAELLETDAAAVSMSAHLLALATR